MNGSDFTPASLESLCENSIPVTFETFESFARWDNSFRIPKGVASDDVAQLCGGAGDTGALLIKRGYKGGPNFDLIVGINLLNRHEREGLLRYLDVRKPKIVLISTPCTGMKGFSALNRAINHTAWLKSRRVSVPLGKLAGKVALIQLRANRDALAEHPQGSDLFKLPVWKLIAREPRLVRVLLHQCMLGLRGPRSGMPIKKPTEIWASDPLLVKYLHNYL